MAEVRQALVIGNGNYHHASRLANTIHDAQGIAENLNKLGFKVTYLADATGSVMRDAAKVYAAAASKPNTFSVFYYSGHGAQKNEVNWLFGTDIGSSGAEDSSINVQALLSSIQASSGSINVSILDACRSLAVDFRSNGFKEGLNAFDAPPGSLIAFATSPGKVASGGAQIGAYSLYTKHLIREIASVATPLVDVFINVGNAVFNESREGQLPWVHSSLTRQPFLLGGLKLGTQLANKKNLESSENPRLDEVYSILKDFNEKSKDTISKLPRLDHAKRILSSLSGFEFSVEELIAMSKGLQSVGARFSPVPDYARELLGIDTLGGLLVVSVGAGSVAQKAGVKEGDVVISINSHRIKNLNDLYQVAGTEATPGALVNVELIRNKVRRRHSGIVELSSIDDLVLEAASWNMNEKNYQRAQSLATWSGDRGNGDANALLANIAANGFGSRSTPDYSEMLKRAQAAADVGNLMGDFWLMQGALRGWGYPQSFSHANKIRREAAASGAPWAIGGLGIAYAIGQGVKKDFAEARRYLEIAAALGQIDGLVGMAMMAEEGLGGPKNLDIARTWYQRAVESGNASAIQMANKALARLGK